METNSAPSARWIKGWTITAVVALGLPVLLAGIAPREVWIATGVIGFFTIFIVSLVVTDRGGPLSRYVPVAVAPAVVGLWPLYRQVVHHDPRPGTIFLYLTAILLAFTVLSASMGFVKRRGWVTDTPLRRWTGFALVGVMFVKTVAGVEEPALTYAICGVMVAVWFWPNRLTLRRAALPPPSPRRPA